MFIARQPIFDKNLDVYGYELLFRLDIDSNFFGGASSTAATASVIGELFESGIDCIVEDRHAFVNFDEDFILSDGLELISPNILVIEMLENIKINSNLIERLNDLKSKGYKIALDDFIEDYNDYPLIPLADIIKFDLIATPLETIKSEIYQAISQNKILLAEKIETNEEFLKSKEMGFHLFQGYFFSKPSIASKSTTHATSKIQYIRLIEELKKEDCSYENLAMIIEKDVNLAYRLMRIVSIRSEDNFTYSIKNALIYMGMKEIEKWINILMIQDLGKSKPIELIKTSLIRTKFAESIALQCELKVIKSESAMMGLFSTLDAILDQDISEALGDISIPNIITEALIHHRGILFPVYELFMAYEKGDWIKTEEVLKKIDINKYVLSEQYLAAIDWANEILMIMK